MTNLQSPDSVRQRTSQGCYIYLLNQLLSDCILIIQSCLHMRNTSDDDNNTPEEFKLKKDDGNASSMNSVTNSLSIDRVPISDDKDEMRMMRQVKISSP